MAFEHTSRMSSKSTFDHYAMFFAIIENQPQKVQALLQRYPRANLNEYVDNFNTPLYTAVDRSSSWPHAVGRYECQWLLLEAGANPFQSTTENSSHTPFSCALQCEDLIALRLMLIAHPLSLHIWRSIKLNRLEKILVGKAPLYFSECLRSTANDALQIKDLKEQAITHAKEGRFTCAAREYEKIVDLYENQIKLETSILYPPPQYLKDHDDPIEKSHPLVINYYKRKQQEFLTQLYQWYEVIEISLANKSTSSSSEIKKYRIEVVDRLISIGQHLGRDMRKQLDLLTKLCQAQTSPCRIKHPPTLPADINDLLLSLNREEIAIERKIDEDIPLLSSQESDSSRNTTGALSWLSSWLHLNPRASFEKGKDKDL